LEEKVLTIERISQVRDIFLFSCYTGLAYIDAKQLKNSDIGPGVDGHLWILSSRQKTKGDTNIPLLPKALEILDKYKKYPQCQNSGALLPMLSNQKMNSYLKEIADLCGIKNSSPTT
jgi:integrase